MAVALNVAFVVESGGVDLGSAAIRVVVTSLAQASFAAIVGYFLARQKLELRPVWWMPLGIMLAATLDGVFTFLRGTVTVGGIGATGFDFGPWVGLALAAALALGVTYGLTALIRREFGGPVVGVEAGPA
jgi:hypothetical protein